MKEKGLWEVLDRDQQVGLELKWLVGLSFIILTFVLLFQYANKSTQSALPQGLGPYADKSTQTYFPADMGPLTEQTALEEQERKWQSRLTHFNKDVRQLLMNRFWRWEENHIKATESMLSGFRASRMVAIRNLHRYLDKTCLLYTSPSPRDS